MEAPQLAVWLHKQTIISAMTRKQPVRHVAMCNSKLRQASKHSGYMAL